MGKLRVLQLINELGAGGAENVVITLADGLNQNKGITCGICPFVSGGVLTDRVKKNTAIFQMGKQSGNDFRLPLKLAALFRYWRPHVVHTHCWGALVEGFIAAKLSRVPIVVHTEHGSIQDRTLNIFIQRFLWHLHEQIIAVSAEHKARLVKTIGFPQEKLLTIYNGVDTSQFSKTGEVEKTAIKALSRIPDNAIILGAVGRFAAVKDHATLIKSFAIIHSQFPNTVLVLIGDGPLRNELQLLAVSLGVADEVLFLGFRDNVAELMMIFDVFVLPSISEGTSCTLLEAMSCGLPVLATRVGGNPEIVKHGSTGLLVPSGDSQKMAKEAMRLIADHSLRTKMGQKGHRRIEKVFNLDIMVGNYQNLYEDLLRRRGYHLRDSD